MLLQQRHSHRHVSHDRLEPFDFAAHNADVRSLWDAYHAGRPYRVPIILGVNTRYYLLNREINPAHVDFRSYSQDPDLMFDLELYFARWSKFNLLQDAQLGLPDAWEVAVDFQNYYEAAWFGCPVQYLRDDVPDTLPAFADCPEKVMEGGLPDPFGGLMARVKEYYEHFRDRASREQFLGRPIRVLPGSAVGTDGIMTVACNLFGPQFVCLAMLDEPERLCRLLEFITEATITRIRAWRDYLGLPAPRQGLAFADDSLALISTDEYRRHILPHHRRLCDALGTAAPRGIHLCGDATRHFRTLRDELNVRTFDTGFPVDFAALRKELGPDVRIQGGPHVQFLLTATPTAVRDRVREILQSGITEGGLFVLREGNNLAPLTPLENTEALYHAGREFGRLRDPSP